MASSTILAALATLALATCSVVNVSPKTAGAFELLILHNNDMHARFEQTSQLSGTCTAADRDAGKCYGGFPRVAHVVKEARKAAASGEGPPVLYLNAGDTYTGTAWFTIYKWKIAAEFLNALKPDAVSLGNHEFDNGVSGLTPFIENLTCPILAANLILSKEPTLLTETNLMNSLVIDINGTKVGVIGYLTPETKVLAIANNVEYIDEVVALQKEVYRLRNDSVNILIALGHSGFARDLEIAKQVEGLDLVIGGHTNTFLWNGTSPDSESPEGPYPTLVKQKSGKQVPVVQAYAYTKYLGKFHMVFDSEGEIVSYDGNPILLDKTVPQDPDVLAVIYKYREAVNNISEVVVGKTSVVFDARLCKKKECNLGNLITDSMIYKYAKEYQGEGWTDAPMAVLQRGGIRSSIAPINLPAAVTTGDLLTVMPFDGHLVTLKINGSDIWKMLEHSVAKYTPAKAPGEFLQMSGIKVIYDLKKRPGMRVVKVTARCGMCDVPEYLVVNKTKEYKLLTTSFLAMGGDGYSIFKGLPIESLSYDELDATTLYLQTHSPVYTAVEDRITLYNVDKMKGNSAATKGLSLVSCLLALITFKFI